MAAEVPHDGATGESWERRLIEASLDPLVTIGLDGKITDVNSATEQATGRTRQELVGTDFSDYFTNSVEAREGYRQAFRAGFVRDYPLQLCRRDGHVTPVVYNASTYRDESGAVVGVFAVARDVTAQRRVEQQLSELNRVLEQRVEEETALRLEKERMLVHQARLAAMGEMIAAIAHQWRQPLNAVGSVLQDLRDAHACGEMDDAYLERAVDSSLAQLQYMSKTIDDFRSFFLPNREKRRFDVRGAVESVLAMLQRQLLNHEIECEIVAPEDPRTHAPLPITLLAHENELKQVLLNLVQNAKDAIEERRSRDSVQHPGRITVRLGRRGAIITISVRDNGTGIPPRIAGRVFEPYFTTKEPGRGTGLGLYMSKMIIEHDLHGTVRFEDVPGGAEFHIEVRDEG